MNGLASQPADRPQRELGPADQARMVEALQRVLCARQPDVALQAFETHISFVLVAGAFAYKLKKAINPGFLDYTSLASRQHGCEEELRLNRRLAPELYLDMVPITGTVDEPVLGGSGEVIDWAVRMRAFAQDGLWDRVVAQGGLQPHHIDELADLLWALHRDADVARADARFGAPAQVRAPMLDNLLALNDLLTDARAQALLDALRTWEAAEFVALEPVLEQRQRLGWVRECHGDLHLGNVTLIDGRTTVFDGIEFNEDFRWIDVISDLAFMAMDLACHARQDLAHRLVNGYLERSGDYAGARVLRYYVAYRALVRAKVAALRAGQVGTAHAAGSLESALRYLELAAQGTRPRPCALLLTHGFSGSGKTTATQELVERTGAIRIRADVERKRLFGLDATARSGSALGAGLYSPDATLATYARLGQLAVPVLQGGTAVVLDATFLRRAQRQQARRLAAEQGVPFLILDFELDRERLRERVRQRATRADEASEADLQVLEAQFRLAEPLQADELPAVVRCLAQAADGGVRVDWSTLLLRMAGQRPD